MNPSPKPKRASLSRRKRWLLAALLAGMAALLFVGIMLALAVSGTVRLRWTEAALQAWHDFRQGKQNRRVLVIGDSFLCWWPVKHCMKVELEKYGSKHKFGMLVRAYGGFGPIEYEDQLQTVGPEYLPDLVMLFYYAGNDLTDVQYRPGETPRRPEGLDPVVKQPPLPKLTRIFSLSTTAWADEASSKTADAAPLPPNEFDWKKMEEYGIDPDLIRRAQNRLRHPDRIGGEYVNPYALAISTITPNVVLDNLLIETTDSLNAWQAVQVRLDAMAKLCESWKSRLMIVMIPDALQVDRSYGDFYRRAKYNLDERVYSSERPQQFMAEYCAARKIEFIDLLPVYKQTKNKAKLYWENDTHWSDYGQQTAYRAVRKQFLDDWRKHAKAVRRPKGQ